MKETASHENPPAVEQPDLDLLERHRPTRFGMLYEFSHFNNIFSSRIFKHVAHDQAQLADILAIPDDEPIIYLLSSENKYDYLYLNYLCRDFQLPLAFISNGSSKLKYSTFRHKLIGLFTHKKKPSPQTLAALVEAKKTLLLFLNDYGSPEQKVNENTNRIFDEIIKLAHDKPDLKIHFIPVGIIWERKAESYQHSLFSEIYGTPTRPSSLRRFLNFLPDLDRLFLKIGEPLCIMHHYVLNADDYDSGQALKKYLSDDIDAMHTLVNGPKIKPHHQLLQEIAASDAFQKELAQLTESTKKTRQELEKEAIKILEKSASKFSLLACKMFCTFMAPMWNFIYNGLYFDTEQFNQIRELSKTHRLVFIPSHKSHMDYLVLSILLYEQGVLPPHIAAGENLNFSFIGGILRRGGAFFIRRSFRGDHLYSACIRHYISKVLHEGYPIEFFIEGGRSRIGQVLQPKYGMLRMIAQTIQDDPSLPIMIIPAAVTYEKVIEDIAYKNEQAGAKKQKENIKGLIKTTKLLISKYGQIYVSFSKPIDMNAMLHISPEHDPISEEEFTANLDDMTLELMDRINRASTITTSSLLSCALLIAETQPMPFEKLLENAAVFLALLIERGALISPVLQTALAASRASQYQPQISGEMPVIPELDASLNLNISSLLTPLRQPMLETLKIFKLKRADNDTVKVDDSSRLQMAFYKNILLYPLIDDIYFACALTSLPESERGKDNIFSRFDAIAQIFSVEFSAVNISDRFTHMLETLQNRCWITEKDGLLVPAEKVLPTLRKLARCILPHIQSYRIVYDAVDSLVDTVEESKYLDALLSDSKQKVSAHGMLPEACSKVFLGHALQKLQSMDIFIVSYKESGKKSIKYLEKKDELPKEFGALLTTLNEILVGKGEKEKAK